MKMNTRLFLRTTALIVGVATIAFSWACIERPMKVAEPQPDVISVFTALQGTTRDVDLLFVIDNSLSMMEEQTLLKENFPQLMLVLKGIAGGLPNVHIGIASTDLGTAPFTMATCETQGGDNGALMKGENNGCANPQGQNFIVDIEAANCNITRDDPNNPNTCTSHDCNADNCLASNWLKEDGSGSTEPDGLLYYEDENGCPRCRNYEGESLETVFACNAELGNNGCGFEQHLEAMYKVFGNNANAGFYREDAYLAIFFITDEDDCSAEDANIFDDQGGIADQWGPLTSFRCTEFGVKCDTPWERPMSTPHINYTGCHSRVKDDPHAMLYPINRYVNFLRQIKDSEMIVAGAIAGPIPTQIGVKLDERSYPKLEYSCGEAVPAIRINEFVAAFTPNLEDMNWAYTSVCNLDYSPALVGLGEKIKNLVEVQCITTPLNGCPDPAAASGSTPITALPADQAEICTPACTVTEVTAANTTDPVEQCPPCKEDDGSPCEWGKINPGLPVSKCFYVRFNAKCAMGYDPDGQTSQQFSYGPSRGAEIIISRRESAEPGTNALIACQGFPLTEKLCSDGVDNDQDGHIDADDWDCQN